MAYHESAHVIVGLANLFLVYNASVSSNDGGNTNYYIYDFDETDDQELADLVLMAELRTITAGLVGERMYYRDICGSSRFPMHLRAGSDYDTRETSQLIRKYAVAPPGAATSQLKTDLKEEVEKFLTQHWHSVKLVAHAIYRKKRLNFSELKYLLTRAEDKEFWKDRFRKIPLIFGDATRLSDRTVKNLITSKK